MFTKHQEESRVHRGSSDRMSAENDPSILYSLWLLKWTLITGALLPVLHAALMNHCVTEEEAVSLPLFFISLFSRPESFHTDTSDVCQVTVRTRLEQRDTTLNGQRPVLSGRDQHAINRQDSCGPDETNTGRGVICLSVCL